ncbi:hypothetical protein TrST_g10439 [Triparma strigata]|uniref:Uncharacterized protein n=1 Tax=Triparma strigata TaxID=1606541 RepID=A0A9W7C275_9STRA|nr:hypothetical protein TrST_g10439 [Triparma strigata]
MPPTVPNLGPGWQDPNSSIAEEMLRYAPFPPPSPHDSASSSSSFSSSLLSSSISQEKFLQHLTSGEPFIAQVKNHKIVAPTTTSTPSFKTIKEWTDWFSSRWKGEEPNLWLGRLKDETQWRFQRWLEEGNRVTLTNYESVAKQFPKTYISIVANEPHEINMIEEVFTTPAFIPKSSFSAAPSMWMYAGLEGAGVDEHIDTIGCVCSWSYMLFGKKRW